MKFTLSWLKEHLETDASLREITDTLTMIGLELEHVHDPLEFLGAFTIAKVIEAKQHPNADRLRVCLVDTGHGDPVQVVCGAPNARTGMTGVFAAPGTHIPGTGVDLKPGVIRGVESNGMLCSERELMLSDDHEGIIDLPAEAPVGTVYAEWAKLDDPVIDVTITPNRGDALGVHGIARDLAAAGLGEVVTKRPEPVAGNGPCPVTATLDFDSAQAKNCPAFGLRLVRGVKNGPSPQWLQRRLQEIGLRPINALVDITNYITFDRGRPLHVFDAAKVQGNLSVRMAKAGEELLALDGKTYALDATMTVIADERGVESLAGIMGGEETGCTEETIDVLIESALWDPITTARTGRKLGVNSDARYRFERGVDPAFTLSGIEMATAMVIELCGGGPSDIHIAGTVPDAERIIDFDSAEVNRLTGLTLDTVEIKHILTRLGFWMAGAEAPYKVAVPSWRPDIHGPADLVEEVVRIIGVDRVPSTPMKPLSAVTQDVLTLGQRRERTARRLLAARGFVEAVTWSFIEEKAAKAFGGGLGSIKLANPISADLSDMRPSLLAGLVLAAKRNADRGYSDTALFEVGQIFSGDRPEDQARAAGGVRHGLSRHERTGRHWNGAAGAPGVFDAKADALALIAALGGPTDKLQVIARAPDWYHPGRSGILCLGPKNVLAHFGELHPRTLHLLDAEGPMAAFEVFLDALPEPKQKASRSKPSFEVSDLMPVTRDFAFVVEQDVEAQKLLRAAQGADKALIAGVRLFDVYEGGHIEAGKKSLAIEVTLQPREKTLNDDEIEAVSFKIISAVTKATGGILRA
ncbi:MAG: phenylalanine--tRNA ligase subunit beta [Hyphomicrobiales bacterium]|nr:phenylalanine--tRNA ligase subunit beta [Hyphomicrobiales bacterium]